MSNKNTINISSLLKTNSSYEEIISYYSLYYSYITDDFMDKIVYSLNCFNDLFVNNTIKSEEKIFISFNGGKDCLAAYILTKYYFYCKKNVLQYNLKKSFKNFCNNKKWDNFSFREYNVYLIYFINKNNFAEEEDYIIEFSKNEKIDIFYLYSDFISGLKFLITNFNLKTIIMGTRQDDVANMAKTSINKINENLLHPSTTPYPEFLRFYPNFHFNYEDIWRLILLTKFKYLSFYDQGYSSLGKTNNTQINQNLIYKIDLTGEIKYLPAWCLEEVESERIYRLEKNSK